MTLPDRRGGVRVCLLPVEVDGRSNVIVVARPLFNQRQMLESVRAVLYLVFPTVLLLAAVAGYLLDAPQPQPRDRDDRARVAHQYQDAPRTPSRSQRVRRVRAARDGDQRAALAHRERVRAAAAIHGGCVARAANAARDRSRGGGHRARRDRSPAGGVSGGARRSCVRNPAVSHASSTISSCSRARMPVNSSFRFTISISTNLIAECVRAARSLAARRGMTLQSKVASEAAVRGDEDLLRRLILNLLDNAIKYGIGVRHDRDRAVQQRGIASRDRSRQRPRNSARGGRAHLRSILSRR